MNSNTYEILFLVWFAFGLILSLVISTPVAYVLGNVAGVVVALGVWFWGFHVIIKGMES